MKKKTIGDHIRSMSDEELAAAMLAVEIQDNEKIPFCRNNSRCDEILDAGGEIDEENMCKQCLIEWLKSDSEQTQEEPEQVEAE